MMNRDAFRGERLRQAREASFMSIQGLAATLKVSRNTVSAIENGDQKPSAELIERLSSNLDVPLEYFFLRIDESVNKSEILWRSLTSTKRAERDRASTLAEWCIQIVRLLENHNVEFPNLNLPQWDIDVEKTSSDSLEEMAEELRGLWSLGDGPISNLIWVLENNGVIVSKCDFHSEKIDGLSIWSSSIQRPMVVLASDKQSCGRSRLDAAHELAHQILHRQIDFERFQSDRPYAKKVEAQAFRFGAALLFPRRSFEREAHSPTLDSLWLLKRRWGTTIAMMVHRAHDLRMISEHEYTRAFKNMSYRGWRRREPLDDEMEQEQPNLLCDAIHAVVELGILSKRELLSRIALSESDVLALCNLEKGFFSERPPSVKIIPMDDVRSESQEG